jgi:hypothetical protein
VKPSSLNLINIPIESRNFSEPILLSWKRRMPSSKPSAKRSMNFKIKSIPYSNKTHNFSLKTNDFPKPFIRKNPIMKFSKTNMMLKIPKNHPT